MNVAEIYVKTIYAQRQAAIDYNELLNEGFPLLAEPYRRDMLMHASMIEFLLEETKLWEKKNG